MLAVLLKVGITQADVADSLGESESTITHLRTNLTHYSLGRREAANRTLTRLLQRAQIVLGAEICIGAGTDLDPSSGA